MFRQSIDGIEYKEIPVTQLQLNYHDNPRIAVNEKRDSLKRSISSSAGKHVILEVSQQHGEKDYTLCRGGNTRLEVLKELHAEWTGEAENPFSRVKCLVFPWNESDSSILGATENIVRGELCYAEEARAVSMLKARYDVLHIEPQEVSFADWIRELGVSMACSSSNISKYLNTDGYITPYMPTLMIEGRAKQVVAQRILTARSTLYRMLMQRYKVAYGVADENVNSQVVRDARDKAQSMTDRICAAAMGICDDHQYDKEKMHRTLLEQAEVMTGMTNSAEELALFGVSHAANLVNRFKDRYKLDDLSDLGDDHKKSAALLVLDAIEGQDRLSANRRTRIINKLEVSNDIAGFIKAVSHLDKTGRKLVAKIVTQM